MNTLTVTSWKYNASSRYLKIFYNDGTGELYYPVPEFIYNNFSVHDKFHRILVLSGFFFLKIASTFLNSSFFPKPIKRRIAI